MLDANKRLERRLQWGDRQGERLCTAHRSAHGEECKVTTEKP